MSLKTAAIVLVLGVMLVAGCSKQPLPAPAGEPPSGTWSGEYGPESELRDAIRVDLHWEKEILRGEVRAGARSMPLTKASFQRDTGAISMEFDAQGNGGQIVHYVVEGQVDG